MKQQQKPANGEAIRDGRQNVTKAKSPWRNRIVGYSEEEPDQLLANPSNWRIHPAAQQNALSGVLKEVGLVQNVVANRTTGHLVDGHLRVMLAMRENQPVVPVTWVELSEEEEHLILASLDPLAAMATADAGALDALLSSVQSGEAAVQQMLAELAEDAGLYQPKDTEDAEPQVDRVEELREQWGVKPGQLWRLPSRTPGQEHRLICGDCTDAATVAQVMGGQLAQMIFTDPPYGVDYDGGMKKREKLEDDHVGTDIYDRALPVLARAADDLAPLYLWYADGHAAAAAAAAAGYQITAQIIWAKNHAQFVTSAHYKGKHEPCYYGHKRNKAARWHGPNNEVTLWEYDRSPSNEYHPTQKPVDLGLRAIRNSTQSGDVVLDGFLGGGTTLIAAENLSRQCRACEISAPYIAVALQRYKDTFGIEAELTNGRA